MGASADLLLLAGSAGAFEGVAQILEGLPATFPLPVVVLIHVPAGRASGLPEILRHKTRRRVVVAEDKLPLEPGVVHVAPPDYHLLVERGGTLALSQEDPIHHSRPSIDALFESAAVSHGARVAAVLLSGASADGAAGLAAIRKAGGLTFVQSPETAQVQTMPEAAIALGAAEHVLEVPAITRGLAALVSEPRT